MGVCANITKTSCACLCATPVRECAQYVRIMCIYVPIGGVWDSLSRQLLRVRLCPYLCAMCVLCAIALEHAILQNKFELHLTLE